MNVPRLVVLSALLAIGAPRARAQEADPSRLFPRELDVRAPEGVARLVLSTEVLSAVRPDLSDVRLYDGDAEVPYLSDSGERPAATWLPLPSLPVTPTGATRRADRTGVVETFVVPAPPAAPPRAHWTLLLDTRVPDFVRALHLETRAPDGTVTALDTSVFRFQGPLRERVTVTPPVVSTPITITLTGQPDGPVSPPALAPMFTWVAVAGPMDAPRVSVALVELGRHRDGAHTFVSLACPPGLHPTALRVETSTTSFVRDVRIESAGLPVGGASLYRIDLPSLRDGAVLELGLDRFTGDRLEVQITDGDSPPLASLRFVAEVVQPAIVFDSSGGTLVLRYGGGRARAPRYDLAALSGGDGERLLSAADLAEATAGRSRPSPRFDPSPALAFLGRPGVAVDATKMTYAADVSLGDAREGVATLRVPAAIVAVARPDYGDLRLVGRDGRQFPYLRDPLLFSRVDLPLRVGPPVREGDETRYSLTLPVTRAYVASLQIDVDARFTERPVTVRARNDEGAEVVVASDFLSRAPGETGPLALSLSGERVHDLVLAVTDGDDAPLNIEHVVAVARVPTLIVAAPPGSYRLLAGDAQLAPPVYEMERGRALIDAVPLAEATVSRPTRNPAYRVPGFFERAGAGSLALWAALLFAVLVLGAVTLRVARTDDAPPPADPAPTPAPDAPPPAEDAPTPPSPDP